MIWNPSGYWNGPPAVLYRSFDTLTGLSLMASNVTINYQALVPGKVIHMFNQGNINQCVSSKKANQMCSIRKMLFLAGKGKPMF